jgi:hypothetical protein
MCSGTGIDHGQTLPERIGFRLSPGLCGSDQTHGIPNRVKGYPMRAFDWVCTGVCFGFHPTSCNQFESPSLPDSEKLKPLTDIVVMHGI